MNFRTTARDLVATSLALAACISPAMGARKSAPPSVGTDQAKGGEAQVGVTYTFVTGGSKVNVKLTGVEFSVSRLNFNSSDGYALVPKTGEKVCILHFQVKNPNPTDMYCGGDLIPFAVVTSDGVLHKKEAYLRSAAEKHPLGMTIKAGQPIPGEIVCGVLIKAQDTVDKIIINLGRFGTTDKVTRYPFGKAPNIVKTLAPVDADPSDATHSAASAAVPGVLGTAYPMGRFDMTVSSIAFAPGPIGKESAGDGKRFLVVTVSAVNRAWSHCYSGSTLGAVLVNSDDEKMKDWKLFKAKRDEPFDFDMVDPDDSITARLAFVIPKDVTGKKLSLFELEDNSGGLSRSVVFDLTGVK